MLEIRGGLDLGQEPLGPENGAELGAQDLERDRAIVPHVVREVDGGHPARAKLAINDVAVCERGVEPRNGVVHEFTLRARPVAAPLGPSRWLTPGGPESGRVRGAGYLACGGYARKVMGQPV